VTAPAAVAPAAPATLADVAAALAEVSAEAAGRAAASCPDCQATRGGLCLRHLASFAAAADWAAMATAGGRP